MKSDSRKSAGSRRPAGLPTPTRTRLYSGVRSERVTARSPFGESEDTAGPWVRWLRLAVSLALAAAAFGALAAGAAGQHLADGTLGLLRDLGGFTGLALLTAALVGGGLAWIGPLAYAAVTLPALAGSWTTPWTWAAPAQPVTIA